MFEKIAIVGVGLIGGSLARAVKEKRLGSVVVGLGRGETNLRKALELGVIDVMSLDLETGIRDADLVVLAAPVGSLGPLIRKIAPWVRPDAVVTDVGSVKKPVVSAAAAVFPEPLRFVGGHPIAGTEHSGVEASFASLFVSRKCILTPEEKTDPEATERVRALWEAVGSEVVRMDVETHDRILGFVSHLPHIVAYALVHAVGRADPGEDTLLPFTAGGFRDFTRIASSHPEMWRDICLWNRDPLLLALEAFEKVLQEFKDLITTGSGAGLEERFQEARRIRAGLPQPVSSGTHAGKS
jgi:prephenate dehydrogenase